MTNPTAVGLVRTAALAVTGAAFLTACTTDTGQQAGPAATTASALPTAAVTVIRPDVTALPTGPVITQAPVTGTPTRRPDTSKGFVDCLDRTNVLPKSDISITKVECWHGAGFIKMTGTVPADLTESGAFGIASYMVGIRYVQAGRVCQGTGMVSNLMGTTGQRPDTEVSGEAFKGMTAGCPATADPDEGTHVTVLYVRPATGADLVP
ncbi:hypothetical protein ACIPW5_06605 [Streptomyces sp. NPDC090077]|uniref:hypothetical protein n=1 Tax=Streptomyces sp. NPDC090077 TaxID=3365938 RepID=UPI003815FE9A